MFKTKELQIINDALYSKIETLRYIRKESKRKDFKISIGLNIKEIENLIISINDILTTKNIKWR